jgi:hypothetical protein
VNLPPNARIDAPSSVVGGKPLVLDGSGSTDPNPNTTLDYSWSQISGPGAPVSDWGSAKLEFTSLPVDQVAEMIFGLVVSDGELSSEQATASIIILDIPNQRPIAELVNEITVESGRKVELDGSVSSDPDGDPLTYSWSVIGTAEVTLEDENDALAEFTAPAGSNTRSSEQFRLRNRSCNCPSHCSSRTCDPCDTWHHALCNSKVDPRSEHTS